MNLQQLLDRALTAPFIFAASLSLAAGTVPLGGCSVEADSGDTIRENREVGDFSEVSFSLPGTLVLSEGESAAVTVAGTADQLEHVVTEVDGGVLRIRPDTHGRDHRHDLDDVRVEVTHEVLEGLSVSGSGQVLSESMRAGRFAVAIRGSARVQIRSLSAEAVDSAIAGSGSLTIQALETGTLDSTIAGSGNLAATGRADSQSISISGSGGHAAAELESRAVEAVISGSGNADVWATGSLDVAITGSGNVVYRGDPRVSKRVAGSGHVRQRRLEI